MGSRSSKVSDGRSKQWVEDKRSYYSSRCLPPAIVLCVVALGILLALVLLGLTIFFVFFWPLPQKTYDISVVKSATNAPNSDAEGWVIAQDLSATSLPGVGGPQSNNNAGTTTERPGGLITGIENSHTSTEVPCEDFEPYLCSLGEQASLCGSTFGLAYCCRTCGVDASCRDAAPGCFQAWYYGLCVHSSYMTACCVSCTYGGVSPPP